MNNKEQMNKMMELEKQASIPEAEPSGLLKGMAVALLIEGAALAVLVGVGVLLSLL